MMHYSAWLLAAAAATATGVALADEPLPVPSAQTICSRSGAFCAVLDPAAGTTVYRIAKDKARTKAWSMPGWFRVAALADDGDHLAAGPDGMNLVSSPDPATVLVTFYRRGAVVARVTLGEIVDPAKLRRTASHWYWGECLGLDEKGRYLVHTVDGRELRFDPTTGRKLP